MSEVLSDGRRYRLAAEELHTQYQQAQAVRACPLSARASWLLAIVSVATTAGALGYGLARNSMRGADSRPPPGADNTLLPAWPEPELPVAEALMDDAFQGAVGMKPAATPWPQEPGIDAVTLTLLNQARNYLLARFPGMTQRGVAQSLVGPALRLLAASVNKTDKFAMQQQLALMINALLPGLNAAEHLPLYGQGRTTAGKALLTSRFTVTNGQVYVQVGQQRYPLQLNHDGIPFIIDGDERYCFIRFNQRTRSWETVSEADNQAYSAVRRQSWLASRMALHPLPAGFSMEINEEYETVTLKIPGQQPVTGVFMAGSFFPVWWDNNGKGVAYITLADKKGSRLLLHSDYGWQFERASVPVGKYLNLLLNMAENKLADAAQNGIGAIADSDGFSLNDYGDNFIKRNHRYYYVEDVNDPEHNSYAFGLADYPGSLLAWQYGVMTLRHADSILFGFNYLQITNALPKPDAFRIEAAALAWLQQHAAIATTLPVSQLRPGLWLDAQRNAMFIIGSQQFAVRRYTNDYIYIRANRQYAGGDILLWSDAGIWLRVREQPQPHHYTELALPAQNEGASEEQQALPVVVETALHNLLAQHIAANTTTNAYPDPDSLAEFDLFPVPVYFHDPYTGRSYFRYNNSYFDAVFIDKKAASIPGGQSCIRVSGKATAFSREPVIATLVLEKKAQRVEIKSIVCWLAEKLNITNAVASLYLNNRPWLNQAGMRELEMAANQVQSAARPFVSLPRKVLAEEYASLNPAVWRKRAQSRLFPAAVNADSGIKITFFALAPELLLPDDSEPPALSDSEQQARRRVRTLLDEIQQQFLPALTHALSYQSALWPTVKAWTGGVLDSDSDEFLANVLVSLRQCWDRANRLFSANRIYLVAASGQTLSVQTLATAELTWLSLEEGRLYINANKLNDDNSTRLALVTAIMQAAAHSSGVTLPFTNIERIGEVYLSAKDVIPSIIQAIMTGALTPTQTRQLIAASRGYLDKIPAYRSLADTLQDPVKLAWLIDNDTAFRTHLLLHSAPFVTLLTMELGYRLSLVDTLLAGTHPWIAHYGRLRGSAGGIAADSAPHRSTPIAAVDGHPHGDKFLFLPLSLPKQNRNRGDQYVPAPQDDVFLEELTPSAVAASAPRHEATEGVELPELSCLGDKEVTFWEGIRMAGEALEKTVTENAKEWQRIYHMDIQGKDCPTPEEINRLTDITEPVDAVINTILSLFPIFWWTGILKNLVGPALRMFADDMQGKETNPEDRKNLFQQVLQMVRQELPTMTAAEKAALLSKPGSKGTRNKPGEGSRLLRDRFSVLNGKTQVKVNDHQYELKETTDAIPFITDESYRSYFIRFNQHASRWELIDSFNEFRFTRENRADIARFGQPQSTLPADHTAIAVEHDLFEITAPELSSPFYGIFLAGTFFRIAWRQGKEGLAFYTDKPGLTEKRVLINTIYGWGFEKPSVPMDKYLAMLLKSNKYGVHYDSQMHLYPIDPADGITRSLNSGRLFIKKDNKYYKVEAQAQPHHYRVMETNGALIKYENGYFQLIEEDNMLFALRTEQVIGKTLTHKPELFRIETSALKQLNTYGLTSDISPQRRLQPGLYANAEGNKVFIVNGKRFWVDRYQDRFMHIKMQPGSGTQNELVLWSDNNTWLRVRNNPEQEESDAYTHFSGCRVVRSPDRPGSVCQPVVVETGLHIRLRDCINNGMVSSGEPVSKDLVVSGLLDIPILYRDSATDRLYFNYKDGWFDTGVIYPDDKDNPTGRTCLKLYSRGNFFGSEGYIATIVVQLKNGRFEIKKQQTFMAEVLGVDENVAENYINNRRYQDISRIDAIEELVSEVEASGKRYVQFPTFFEMDLPRAPEVNAQRRYVSDMLFPYRITSNSHYQIKFLKLDHDTDSLPSRQQQAVRYIRDHYRYLKESIIPLVSSALYPEDYHWPDVEDYLRKVLKTDDYNFHVNVALALRERLQLISSALNEHNIYIMTAVLRGTENAEAATILSPSERSSGTIAHMSPWRDGQFFINTDKLDIAGNESDPGLTEPVQAMLQALFDSRGITSRFYDIEKNNGMYVAVMEAINQLAESMRLERIPGERQNKLQEVSKTYLESVPTYKRELNTILEPEKLAYMMDNDPAYRAHLLLNSADFLSLMVQDVYYRLRMSEFNMNNFKPDAWFQMYGARRGVNPDPRYLIQINSITPANIDTVRLEKVNVQFLPLTEVAGEAGIYSSLSGVDKLIKYGDAFYPVEFIGKERRIVLLGSRKEPRQAYYYNPQNGEISPIQKSAAQKMRLSYHRDLELYESTNLENGNTAVLKYDAKKERLVETGGKRIIRMPNKIRKVEFDDFDFFFPAVSSREVYIDGHGSYQPALSNKIPQNVNVNFYTAKGNVLWGYYNDIYDLVKGKFTILETKKGGDYMESYIIEYDHEDHVNYHALAQTSQKNLVRVRQDAVTTSRAITEAVAKLFIDDNVDIHFYICRTFPFH